MYLKNIKEFNLINIFYHNKIYLISIKIGVIHKSNMYVARVLYAQLENYYLINKKTFMPLCQPILGSKGPLEST
jgi:hypothetical protein